MKNLFFSVFLTVFLIGCETLAPDFSTNSCLQKVVFAEIGLTEIYQANNEMLESRVIGADVAKDVGKILDASNVLLDRAAVICPLDTRNAINILAQAKKLVLEANAILGRDNG